MTVQDYLDRYYWNAFKLAECNELSIVELDQMIVARLIPKASYVVTGAILKSAAFGDLDAQGARDGAYFHPASSEWIRRAQSLPAPQNPDALKQQFFAGIGTELAILNRDVWRLVDAFDDFGQPHAAGLDARIGSYWDSFLAGIFGLCVANPVSEREIACKEILQEKLTALTANGTLYADIDISSPDLLLLIDAYEDVSMPFSPVEYPNSSRKRLIDDLRRKCATLL